MCFLWPLCSFRYVTYPYSWNILTTFILYHFSWTFDCVYNLFFMLSCLWWMSPMMSFISSLESELLNSLIMMGVFSCALWSPEIPKSIELVDHTLCCTTCQDHGTPSSPNHDPRSLDAATSVAGSSVPPTASSCIRVLPPEAPVSMEYVFFPPPGVLR